MSTEICRVCKKPTLPDSYFCSEACRVTYWGPNNMGSEKRHHKLSITEMQAKLLQWAKEYRQQLDPHQEAILEVFGSYPR